MFGQKLGSAGPAVSTPTDPNELQRAIYQNTTMTYHWVRAGVIAIVILLVLIVLGF